MLKGFLKLQGQDTFPVWFDEDPEEETGAKAFEGDFVVFLRNLKEEKKILVKTSEIIYLDYYPEEIQMN